ncbi:hypothetical protein ABZV29_27715 [Streptomyces sp. NPDC005236]|uniref:hypothetical protein n=1 Tax=Streptomyces sp. NPDC005236 TaxID=3157028 RepID=UPI0033B89781
MTSPLSRSRSRRVPSQIAVRVAHAVLGGLVAMGWLLLPLARAGADAPAAASRNTRAGAPAAATATAQDATSTGDLVPPLVAAGAAGAVAAYGYGRRRRRATTRTTPGGDPGLTPLPELDRQTRRLLVETDDCVRVGAEELALAADRSAGDAVEPYVYDLRHAEAGLAAAFRLRQSLDEAEAAGAGPDPAGDEDDRRDVLEEIVARCQDAGQRLDAAAPGFDQIRALERNAAAALESAETRFREAAARTRAAEATIAGLHQRYAPAASLPVAGDAEQAKDRLLFTTSHLNQARQYADRGDGAKAAAHLRAAEGALAQAFDLVDGVDRLAGELASAAAGLPAAIAAAEAARDAAMALPPDVRAGLVGPLGHAESLLSAVRHETAAGPHDPLDALRRVTEAAAAPAGAGGANVPEGRGNTLLPARSALAGAACFIGTHRGAVGSEARTRLAEARRLLGPGPVPLSAVLRADGLAREARRLAERDVRAYGNPSGGRGGAGAGGAVLGGILLSDGEGGPMSYGGPRTRGRRGAFFT